MLQGLWKRDLGGQDGFVGISRAQQPIYIHPFSKQQNLMGVRTSWRDCGFKEIENFSRKPWISRPQQVLLEMRT